MNKKCRISNKQIIQGVAGVIYRMHPFHKPENFNKIIDEFESYFNSIEPKNDTFKLLDFDDWKVFEKWIKGFLFDIKEFTDLNISQKLKESGITDYNDQRNSGIKFSTRYDVDTLDSRYSDFIDLDACVRNIVNSIYNNCVMDDDCFLCKFSLRYGSTSPSNTEPCLTCLCNPELRYNREPHPMALKPKSEWTEEEKTLYNLD